LLGSASAEQLAPLSLLLGVEGNGTRAESGVFLLGVQLVLEGEGLQVTMSSSESQAQDGKQAVTFRCAVVLFGVTLGH